MLLGDLRSINKEPLSLVREIITAETIGRALGGKKIGKNWRCKCPAHDDKHPSLDICDGPDGRPLVICRSGCPQNAVIEALRPMGLWYAATPEQRQASKLAARETDLRRAETVAMLAEGMLEAGEDITPADLATIEQARDAVAQIKAEIDALKTPEPSPHTRLYFTYADLIDSPPPEPESMWQGATIFRGARVLLAGGAKMGKSDFFLALAMAAATGGEFLEQPFARPYRVLWLQAEIHQGFLLARAKRLAVPQDAIGLLRENLVMTPRLNIKLDTHAGRKLIQQIITDVRPDIIGIDPFINFFGVNENDNKEVHAALTILDGLGDQHAMVALHHTGKGEAKGFDAIRGASAFRGWYDSGLLIQGDPKTLAYELRNAKSPQAHGLQLVEGEWRRTFEKPREKGEGGRPRVLNDDLAGTILELIREQGEIAAGDLLTRVMAVSGTSQRSVERTLSDLRAAEIIESTGSSRTKIYRICE